MPAPIHGFVYTPTRSEIALACATVGARVRNPDRGPPWLVVDHVVTGPIVTDWPGRLLRVVVVDPATDADGAGNLRSDASYTRAVEVAVLEELPLARLFGEHGAHVVRVIERARRLTREEAALLADAIDEKADAACSAAWNAWLVAEGRESSIHFGDDHSFTLAIPAYGSAGAPIHGGFSVIADQLRKRALKVEGAAAITLDEEGDASLTQPWSDATRALLHAAMALGAPALVEDEQSACLQRAWTALVGNSPGSVDEDAGSHA